MIDKTANDGSNRKIVFIGGYMPTALDRALAEEHGTNCFRNALVDSGVEKHLYAVSVPADKIPKREDGTPEFEFAPIPEGYTTFETYAKSKPTAKAPASSRNPNSPLVAPPARTIGLPSE